MGPPHLAPRSPSAARRGRRPGRAGGRQQRPASRPRPAGAARRLRARRSREAGHCLRTAAEFVQAASQHEPVPAAQRELLRAVPRSALPARRLPGPDHDITGLREGIIVSAQRIRRVAWRTATQTAPVITIGSLRHIADASTLTSYHCELLLRAAADRAAAHFPTPDASQEITRAADAAGRARASWLAVARTLTGASPRDTRQPPPAAGRNQRPRSWTGRLTYADPGWTLTSGPAPPDPATPRAGQQPGRHPAAHLGRAPKLRDRLEANAAVEHDQLQAAARAGRILVPTRSLPRARDPRSVHRRARYPASPTCSTSTAPPDRPPPTPPPRPAVIAASVRRTQPRPAHRQGRHRHRRPLATSTAPDHTQRARLARTIRNQHPRPRRHQPLAHPARHRPGPRQHPAHHGRRRGTRRTSR